MFKTTNSVKVIFLLVIMLTACNSPQSNDRNLIDTGGVRTVIIEKPIEDDGKYDSTVMYFIYEKNGITKAFSIDELTEVDSTWKFVSRVDSIYKDHYK